MWKGHSISSQHVIHMPFGIVFSSWLIIAVVYSDSFPLETCLIIMCAIWHFCFFFLWDESRALFMLSSCFTTELHPQTLGYTFVTPCNSKDWASTTTLVDGKVWERGCYLHCENKNGMTLVPCRIRNPGGKRLCQVSTRSSDLEL